MVTISLKPTEIDDIIQTYIAGEDPAALNLADKIHDIQLMQKFYNASNSQNKKVIKLQILEYFRMLDMDFIPGMPSFLKPKTGVSKK